MKTSDLGVIASAFWAEYIMWSWRAGPDGTYVVTRATTDIEPAPTMSDAKSRCTVLRRLAAAKAVLITGVVVPAEDDRDLPTGREKEDYEAEIRMLRTQRNQLLTAFLKPYKDIPDDFLGHVVAGSKTSVDISAELAEAILAGRSYLDVVTESLI